LDRSDRTVLDMDSSESPVPGSKKASVYNGPFESVCYHPLFLFNGHGDCLAAKLRPGNVDSVDDWDELLQPEIERLRDLWVCAIEPAAQEDLATVAHVGQYRIPCIVIPKRKSWQGRYLGPPRRLSEIGIPNLFFAGRRPAGVRGTDIYRNELGSRLPWLMSWCTTGWRISYGFHRTDLRVFS
jgi:hypothetical protein